jgi:tetraacyldisaccharide-1-P 4'-kinase
VAIAWARREAKAGTRVALIGHAYGARPGHARIVSKNDDVREVGDEALVCARALEGVTDVVVAPSRQTAAEFAVAHGARILVLDGVAQISPRRADVALLVRHDENRLRACPPAGDLRAPISALRALADFVVVVSDEESPQIASGEIAARVVSEHAYAPNGDVISFSELAKMRVGVALSIAHPERVLRMLARRGVVPLACATVRDHRGDDLRRAMTRVSRRDGAIEVWLISDKCASFVAPTSHDTIPIYVIAHRAELRGGGVS